MGWYQVLYEGNSRGERPPESRPKGFKLLLDILHWHWWTLVKANILFWLFCLPVVTIPAAVKAMTRVCILLLRREPMDLLPDWWEAFRQDFPRTTIVGAIIALVLGTAGVGVGFYGRSMAENGLLAAPVLLMMVAMAVVVMSLFSLFSLLEFSELSLGDAIRSALLLVLVRLPQNLAVLVLLVVLVITYLLAYPYSTFVVATIAFSLYWLIACFAAWPGLEKYVFRTEKGRPPSSE